MRTDAQLHVWEADRPDRPWAREHRPQLPEPFTIERAVALLDEHGVDRAVLVPPLVSGFNNDTANAYALEGAAAYPERFAVMGRFDPRPPDARERLEHWLEQPGMRGVRFSLEGPPAPQLIEEGALDWFWPEAERLGVAVYFLRPGRPQDIAAVAERHPDAEPVRRRAGHSRDEAALHQCLSHPRGLVLSHEHRVHHLPGRRL
jgi:predicted TIM-barrel fold metal-dependent hydrolase